MAFRISMGAKPSAGDDRRKRSPIAGWLGRRKAEDDAQLPEIDVARGLNRVLNRAQPNVKPDQTVDRNAPIRDALAAIEASLYSIDQIREVIEQSFEVVLSANDVEDVAARALLAESFDELRLSIDKIVAKADERAQPLIGKAHDQIDVNLGGSAHYTITPMRLDISDRGLGLNPPRDAFASFDEITSVLAELDAAMAKADRAASGYCKDAQFLIGRMNAAAN